MARVDIAPVPRRHDGLSDLDKWDPRKEDYARKDFNSYTKGLGKAYSNRDRGDSGNEVKLYVKGIPTELSQEGIKNLFLEFGDVVSVKKCVSKFPDHGTTFGFVGYKTTNEALAAIRKLNDFQITAKYRLSVQLAVPEEERKKFKAKKLEEEEFLNSLTGGKDAKTPQRDSSGDNCKESSPASKEVQSQKIKENGLPEAQTNGTELPSPQKVDSRLTSRPQPKPAPEVKAATITDGPTSDVSTLGGLTSDSQSADEMPVAKPPSSMQNRASPVTGGVEASVIEKGRMNTMGSYGGNGARHPPMVTRTPGLLGDRPQPINRGRGVGRGLLAVSSGGSFIPGTHLNQQLTSVTDDQIMSPLQPVVQKKDDLKITLSCSMSGEQRQVETNIEQSVSVPEYSDSELIPAIGRGRPFNQSFSPPPRPRFPAPNYTSSPHRGGYHAGPRQFSPRQGYQPRPQNFQPRFHHRNPASQPRFPYGQQYPRPQQHQMPMRGTNRQLEGRGRGIPLKSADNRGRSPKVAEDQKLANESIASILSDSGSAQSEMQKSVKKKVPCAFCGKPGSSKCKVCKTYYCSRQCQQEDWNKHKYECKQISERNKEEDELAKRFDVSVDEELIVEYKKALIDYQTEHPSDDGSTGASSAPEPVRVLAPGESIPQRQLALNKPNKVVVSWIGNPCDVWLLPMADKTSITSFLRLSAKIQKTYTVDSKPLVSPPSKGEYCVALYVTNNSWYRARVKEANSSEKVSIFYIDYGNTDVVSLEFLRKIDPAFLQMPAQAVGCVLDGFSERPGYDWSEESVGLCSSLITDDKVYTATPSDWRQGRYIVQLHDPELTNSPSLTEQLKISGCTTSPSVAQERSVFRADQLPSIVDSVKIGDKILVTMVFARSPMDFKVQLCGKQNIEDFTAFYTDLNTYYQSNPSSPYLCSVGELVVAQYSEDNSWYRAKVEDLKGEEVKLVYVDFGNEETRPLACVRKAGERCRSFPVQAVDCCLSGIRPPGNKDWSTDLAQLLQGLPPKLKASVMANTANKLTLDIVGDDGMSLAAYLVSEGLAEFEGGKLEKTTGAVDKAVVKESGSADNRVQQGLPSTASNTLQATRSVPGSKSSVVPDSVKPALPTSTSPEETHTVPLTTGQAFPCANLKLHQPTQAYCSVVDSDGAFYIQNFSPENLENLQILASVDERYKSSPAVPFRATKGQKVRANFMDSWCRAIVQNVHPDNTMDIFFIDYGNTERLPANVVQELDESLLTVPGQAIKCMLNGSENVTWSTQKAAKMKEMLVDKLFTVTLATEQNGCSYVLMDQDGVDVNKVLLGDCGSSPNVRSDIDKNHQPLPAVFPAPSMLQLKLGGKIQAMCTHVEEDGSFFVQYASEENVSNLQKMADVNAAYYERALVAFTCQKGQTVCAMYLDSWCRAVVRAVHPDSSVEVFFLDYGNTAKLPAECIQSLDEQFLGFPAQGVKCRLSGSENVEWSSEMTAKLAELIQEKMLEVTPVVQQSGCYLVDARQAVTSTSVNSVVLQLKKAVTASPSRTSEQNGPRQQQASTTYFPVATLPQGQATSGLCVVVERDGTFYIQTLSQENAANLKKLVEMNEVYYQKPLVAFKCQKGQKVCAKYMDSWSRAVVTDILPDSIVETFFVDYGNTEKLSADCIQSLDEQYFNIPAQGLKCKLSGSEKTIWSAEMGAKLSELLQDKMPDVALVKSLNGCNYVNVSVEGVDVNSAVLTLASLTAGSTANVQQNGLSESVTTPFPLASVPLGQATQCLCSVVDKDGSFYVQSAADQNIPNLTRLAQLHEFYQQKPLVSSRCQLGQKVCGKFSDTWSRAVVKAIHPDTSVTVFFVDYGNTEKLPADCVQNLDEQFLDIPALGIKCKLYGSENVKWSTEMVSSLKELVEEKILTVTVEKELDGCRYASVSVDGANVNSAVQGLAEHNVPRRTPSPPATDFPMVTLQHGQETKGSCVMVEMDGSFYIQKDSPENLPYLQDLARMNELYLQRPVVSFTCQRGQKVCAKFLNSWNRAIVREVHPDSTIEVFFVDFGNTERLPVDCIQALGEEFISIPVQGILCKLNGSEMVEWTLDMAAKLGQLIQDKMITVTCVKELNGCCYVNVKESGVNVNSSILSRPVAPSVPKPSASVQSVVPQQRSSSVGADYKSLSLEQGKSTPSVCVVIDPDGSFYVQIASAENMVNLGKVNEISEVYSQRAFVGSSCQKGQKVCAKFMDCWSRGIIRNIHPDSSVEVYFVDYGNTEKLPSTDVQGLDERFCEIPAQGLKCRLSGVENVKWSPEMTATLTELIHNKVCSVTLVMKREGCNFVDVVGDGANINKEILGQQVLSPEQPKVSPAVSPRKDAPSNLECAHLPLSQPTEISCFVVEDDGSFFVQHLSQDNITSLLTLAQMDETYQQRNFAVLGPFKPVKGQLVCAKFDGAWCRGEVKTIHLDGSVDVFFVDYGNSAKLPAECVQKLDVEYSTIPAQAIRCILEGRDAVNWSPSLSKELSDLILEKKATVTLTKEVDGCSHVKAVSENGVDVNQSLLTRSQPTVPECAKTLTQLGDAKLDGNEADLVLMTIISPAEFYCVSSEAEAITKEVHTSMANLPLDSDYAPDIDELCCAIYPHDERWYRAAVVERDVAAGQYEVVFIDYGDRDVVQQNALKRPQPGFTKPPSAIHCVIPGVKCSAAGMWSPRSIEIIQGCSEQLVHVKVDRVKDGLHEVQLFRKGVDIGALLRAASQPAIPAGGQQPSGGGDAATAQSKELSEEEKLRKQNEDLKRRLEALEALITRQKLAP